MRGNVKLKRINKKTGETDILFEDSNQTTTGFGHTIVNILTGQGSRNLEDYQVGYFQLGSEAYDLDPSGGFDDFGMSADVGVSANIPFFWTLKSAFSEADYGNDSRSAIVKRRQYGFGSYVPSGAPTTALFSNFVQPPETTKTLYDYSDRFYMLPSGTDGNEPNGSGIFVAGCADTFAFAEENVGEFPMYSELDSDVSGPDNQPASFKIFMTPNRKPPTDSCLRPGTTYVYAEDGRRPDVWRFAEEAQTQSYYWRPEYYASGTPLKVNRSIARGRNQIFLRSAQAYTGFTQAGQNYAEFRARYEFDEFDSTDSDKKGTSRLTPIIIEASTGYQNCVEQGPDCVSAWENAFGLDGGGVLSANIANRHGYIYTYANTQGSADDGGSLILCASGPYGCFDGPGASAMDDASAGFGPDGQWFRVTTSWYDVPSGVTGFERAGGPVLQAMLFPMYRRVKNNDMSTLPLVRSKDRTQPYYTDEGSTGMQAEITPRPAAYISLFQYENNPFPTAKQKILGEKPYYITQDNHFVKVPRSYTTSLNDNTVNIRLLIDENMAVGQTIKEIGLFSKNPNGNRGVDQPYLIAYKSLCDPLIKNDEFSYIVDWELSVIDDETTIPEQETCTPTGGGGGEGPEGGVDSGFVISIVDTEAAIFAMTPADGAVAYATDTENYYIYDDGAWSIYEDTGS